jgi:hypothetical protein
MLFLAALKMKMLIVYFDNPSSLAHNTVISLMFTAVMTVQYIKPNLSRFS